MNGCPDTATLRLIADADPVSGGGGATDADATGIAAHIESCDTCQAASRRLREDADVAATALVSLDGPALLADIEDAWRRFSDDHADAAEVAPPSPRWHVATAPLRRVAAAAVVAVIAIGVVATPQGRAVATDFLSRFRSEHLAVVTFDPAQIPEQIGALERLGRVRFDGDVYPRPVRSLEQAARVAGLRPAAIDAATLPSGLAGTPEIMAAPAQQVRVTFDRDRAPDLPVELDGATLVIDVPAVVLQTYLPDETAYQEFSDGLVVAEAGQVTASVEGGATLGEVRAALLALPDLPPQVVAQLRAIDDWRSTLPIPVPVDVIDWQDTTVAGTPALRFDDTSGLGSAVLWQREGRIRGVAGTFPADDLQRIADGMR